MNFAPLRSVIRRTAAVVAVIFLAALIGVGGPPQVVTSVVTFHPAVSDFQFITASETPPTQAQCASVNRRSSAGVGFQTTDLASDGSALDDGFLVAPLRNGSTDGVLVEGRMSVIRSVLADVEEL